jgi:SAM-dependent methyltransferase
VTDSNRESSSYDEASPYYDIVYEAKKDYAREAERLRDVLTRYAERPVRELLDMACGTGLHDQHLAASYDVEGADLSSEHLAIARRRCPDLVFHKADMTGFDLGRDFDAVICLFSSIGHVLSKQNLFSATRAMAAHVRAGGLVVIEPFIDPADFREGHISVEEGTDGEMRVVRVSYSEREGNVLTLLMHHFVSANKKVATPEPLTFKIAMFTSSQLRSALEAAGLEVFQDSEGLTGRGLYIGRKPSSRAALRYQPKHAAVAHGETRCGPRDSHCSARDRKGSRAR